MLSKTDRVHIVAYTPIDYLAASQENIENAISCYKSDKLVPVEVIEQTAISGNKRIKLTNYDDTINVFLWSNRVEVILSATNNENSFSTSAFDDLFDSASILLAKAESLIESRYNRIAYVGEGVVANISIEDEKKYYNKFIKSYGDFNSSVPFEWTMRHAIKSQLSIGNNVESLNIIAQVDRFSGSILEKEPKKISGIKYLIDINSSPENATPRFSKIIPFSNQLKDIFSHQKNSMLLL